MLVPGGDAGDISRGRGGEGDDRAQRTNRGGEKGEEKGKKKMRESKG